MPEPSEMNKLLQGKNILNVENGTTPGWMVIQFDPKEFGNEVESANQLFMAILWVAVLGQVMIIIHLLALSTRTTRTDSILCLWCVMAATRQWQAHCFCRRAG